MAIKSGPSVGRKPRADAERNRGLLLATAKTVFAAKGSSASLDEIARIAGVGAGTLYRHFPNRDALVKAVYDNEIQQLVAAADRLAETLSPVEALREWLLLLFDYMTTKHAMLELLNTIAGGPADLHSTAMALINQAASKLIDGGAAIGDIRQDIDPKDPLLALVGVAKFDSGPDARKRAQRLVDILIAGMRAAK